LIPVEKNAVEKKRTKGTPNLADPYVPLTSDEKFQRWVHSTYSPYTFSSALFSAVLSQAAGDWRDYGGGMQGFGKRFGASLAETESSGFFKVFLLPEVLHQDPRYFAMRKGGVKRRIWYSTTRVLVARKDDGGNTFNASEVVGTLLVQSLQNAWVPRANRGFDDTMSGTAGAIVSDAGSNLLREFWPDISRIFHKHEPASIKKIEQKMPKVATQIVAGEEK
jgi:hypothetical protein